MTATSIGGQTLAGESLLVRYFNFVKLPHTLFALPFALLGIIYASFEQPPETYSSFLRALDGTTGDLRWEYEVQPITMAGVLSTAGNLVFSGATDGFVFALDAETGEVLWNLSLGGPVISGPMSYAVDGNQYVTISAGNSVFTFGLR